MAYAHRVEGKVDLAKIETSGDGDLNQEEGKQKTVELGKELEKLQELLYAAGTHSLLIVLQGRDTAGKDGAIKKLSQHLNVQGVNVVGFKVPTAEEAAHDFLWRVHKHTPAKGQIAVFNRSHYEDVLVVRVHNLVPKETWQKRYSQINEFEQLITQNDTIVVKFCLHISKEEQEERLLAREQEVEKSWKLSVGDWKEREHWDAYTEAYSDALSECSSKRAPWYVISADRKWYRDLAIVETLVDTLRPYESAWRSRLETMGQKAKGELEEYRRSQPAKR